MAGTTSHTLASARAAKRDELRRLVGADDSRQSLRTARGAEKALWSAETAEMLAAVPMRLMITDGERVVRYLNPSALAEMDDLMGTLGLRGSDLVGLPIDVLSATPGYVAADAESAAGPSTFRSTTGRTSSRSR